MSHLNGESLNIKDKNIEKLVELFPEVNTDGKIDFEKLKQILGEYVDDSEERYRFVWNGKGQALRLSQTPSMGTLRPAKEEGESKNWDKTGNLYIEGDNLEVLKLLQKSYFNKVKMIYIDPPYNTGGDFVYKDNFKDNIQNYKKITGQVDSEGNATTTNREYSGRYHTDWLNMMYPRLRLARNILKDDGVIFISIDDNEVHNLRKICDEVFGEDNFIDVLKWKRKKQPSFLAKHTAKVMEYILVYAKSFEKLEKLSIENLSDATKKVINISNPESTRTFKKGVRVKIGESGVIKAGRYKIRSMEVEYLSDVIYQNGVTINDVEVLSRFSVSQDNIDNFIDEDLLFITVNKGLRRDVTEEEKTSRKSITDLLLSDYGDNQESDNEFKSLFGEKYFDYTKPINLIYNLIKSNFTENEVIMDFFSGSSTTADAVMQINADDGGSRKCISVQLPEDLDAMIETADTETKSKLQKAINFLDSIHKPRNLAEIGKERIRRAGEKIKEELKERYEAASDEERKNMKHPNELDIGFKVFKLDSSNIKEWNPGKYENVQQAIEDALTPYVPGRTEEDVVYEMMLKMGLDLTYPVEEVDVNGKTIYSIGYGFLMICLADKVDIVVAEKMIEIKDENNQQEFRAIFRDEGFSSDTDKTNVKETLRSAGLAEESFITL